MAKSVPEQIADLVFAKLTGIQTAFGRRETEAHAKPPRVVAVPLGAPVIREANRPGDAGYSNQGRILYVREFDIEWYCHARRSGSDTLDFAQAEDLLSRTVKAIRNVCHNSVRFADEDWRDQREGEDGYERDGSLIVVRSTIDLPLYEAVLERVTLTADPPIDTTVTLNGQEG